MPAMEGGVSALALTPQDDFGDLLNLQGFKSRFETVLWLGPILIAGKKSLLTVDGTFTPEAV